ncbi:MAG: HAMP domain-containing protein, partial [Thermoanaerobaculia bacterium]|nr:HAMP domain-containing protein [Thermoanaerobaculia bacterium]
MTNANKRLLTIWLISIGIVVVLGRVDSLLSSWGPLDRILAFSYSAAVFVLIVTSGLVLVAVVRFILRKLFWRVGSRLALSYTLIGVLPFLLFAILLTVIGYIGVGVLSQASFRSERRSDLSRLEYANVEYALTGQLAGELPSNVEVYDTDTGTGTALPDWLRQGSFKGLLLRNETPVLAAAKRYDLDGRMRTVGLVVPLDEEYVDYFQQRSGIQFIETLGVREGVDSYSFDPDESDYGAILGEFFAQAARLNAIFWADSTPQLMSWETGEETDRVLLFAILNPYSNLFNFYLGSSRYLDILLGTIFGLALSLLLVYGFAALLAIGLIFSITRAINRIEKGTNAVERGDFSYRINMARRNQLGDLAQSFDRMTASISSLLESVAEKERLQSEIAIAADIQQNLLPKRGPDFDEITFSAHFEPTASIGGDYYDVFHLGRRRFAVAIGDVSGHGLSTGLVMAMVKAAITTLIDEGADESSLFRRLNE